LGYHGSSFSLDWQCSEMEPWSVPLKLWLCKSSMKVESKLICYSAVGQIELGWVCLKRGYFHCKWHGKKHFWPVSEMFKFWDKLLLQLYTTTKHGSISLNCHSDEDNRMSFHMTTTTRVLSHHTWCTSNYMHRTSHYSQSMKIISFQIWYKCYLTSKCANNTFNSLFFIENCKKRFESASL
jgi:hypothetical protein